jgi:uncharacterized protein (UPF0248 family)
MTTELTKLEAQLIGTAIDAGFEKIKAPQEMYYGYSEARNPAHRIVKLRDQ